jgi:hypothetical protein
VAQNANATSAGVAFSGTSLTISGSDDWVGLTVAFAAA